MVSLHVILEQELQNMEKTKFIRKKNGIKQSKSDVDRYWVIDPTP